MRAALAGMILGAALGLQASPAPAQSTYPTGPIKVIIPLAPGGAIDVMVRALGKAFEQRNPHGFVVESRAGANTIIAANACKGAGARRLHDLPPVAQQRLDQSGALSQPVVRSAAGFRADHQPGVRPPGADPQQERAGPGRSRSSSPTRSRNPDKLNFGSFGVGGDTHLIVEWLKHETGAQMTHIPFKGASAAMMAFAANDIQLIYLIVGNLDLARQINEGEVKGLLVPGATRNALVPNVPSFAESGLSPDRYAFETWFGMFAPKGTRPRSSKIAQCRACRDREVAPNSPSSTSPRRCFDAVGDTPEAFIQFIKDDMPKAKILVDLSGAKLDQ